MIIKARAPLRVDFAGAWTDVPYFSDPFVGATLNAAIRVYVRGALDAREEDSRQRNDAGAAAGLSVQYESTIPAGSGLGTSAALNVVWLALVRRVPVTNLEDKMDLAALAFDIEKVLGIIGGKQDQYASALGGINLFEFSSEGVRRQPVDISEEDVRQLEELLVLCYTGKSRLSSNIHKTVWGNFRAGRNETVRALFTLRDTAYEAKECLETGDIDRFGEILSLQFDCMKELDASTSNEQIADLFELAEPMIRGGKPCGAGGGGCLLFLARSPGEAQTLAEELRRRCLTVLDLRFDFEGLELGIFSDSATADNDG